MLFDYIIYNLRNDFYKVNKYYNFGNQNIMIDKHQYKWLNLTQQMAQKYHTSRQ
jgi:hypothetical protein